jgi:polyisoprenoid-binding protein YceI
MLRTVLVALALLTALPATAAPRAYALDPAGSEVGFLWSFGKDEIRGTMPVAAADITLDFDSPARSSVHVEIDAAAAQAGFPFATQALTGPKMLDTAQHPRITFDSTEVTGAGDTARIQGHVTIRGVTRPMEMTATLRRPTGTAEGDFSALTVRLTGTLSRSDFGAAGWSDMVADAVTLDIRAALAAR